MRKLILVAAAAVSLSACASNSNTVVLENSRVAYEAQNVELVYDEENATVDVEEGKLAKLDEYLRSAFVERGFTPGEDGLTVRYGFVGYDEGSQAMRYLAGGLAGGAKMVIVAEYFDAEGNSLAKIHAEGTVAGGFFGGDSDSAIKGAAKKIATFAEDNFSDDGE
ncbi:hypothetical protein [Sphingomicrobium sediminis]|uniref:DUF4410 domain-containing protein n=1 Tax=Sphingomicrobium sediminis TaxID=2950949 RepID=A0A9X2ELM2_9SPHN|nr:hypothetical protein [Sphingomicrobium sediminis]MCM8557749.1 hypothetical protein [Sphingomicrobium sediminis]